MTFRETLEQHLRAIRARDLTALAETLSDAPIVLVTADGRLVRSASEFLEMHRGWFASPTWSLGFEEISITETPDLAVAVLRLDYRDQPPGARPLHETSYLTLVFARQGSRWVMIQDQNTPVRQQEA